MSHTPPRKVKRQVHPNLQRGAKTTTTARDWLRLSFALHAARCTLPCPCPARLSAPRLGGRLPSPPVVPFLRYCCCSCSCCCWAQGGPVGAGCVRWVHVCMHACQHRSGLDGPHPPSACRPTDTPPGRRGGEGCARCDLCVGWLRKEYCDEGWAVLSGVYEVCVGGGGIDLLGSLTVAAKGSGGEGVGGGELMDPRRK